MDEAVALVHEELAAKRAEWQFEEDPESYFYTFVCGGNWTKAFKGIVADSVQCKARSSAKGFWSYFFVAEDEDLHFQLVWRGRSEPLGAGVDAEIQPLHECVGELRWDRALRVAGEI